MPTIEESIEVAVPVRTAYNQWTQFEQFPQLHGGDREVSSSSTTQRLMWTAKIAGKSHTWEAEDHRAGDRPAHRLDEPPTARPTPA